MAKKTGETSAKVASTAAKVLKDPKASKDAKSIAASALKQTKVAKKAPEKVVEKPPVMELSAGIYPLRTLIQLAGFANPDDAFIKARDERKPVTVAGENVQISDEVEVGNVTLELRGKTFYFASKEPEPIIEPLRYTPMIGELCEMSGKLVTIQCFDPFEAKEWFVMNNVICDRPFETPDFNNVRPVDNAEKAERLS